MQQIMKFDTPKSAWEWCEIIAKSAFVPVAMRNKPEDVMVAIQYGSELKLSPMQSLQSIAVINGRPCVWGDGLLGICLASDEFEDMTETQSDVNGIPTAVCIVKRRNRSPVTHTYDKNDATTANLWNKPGPWKQYPYRMLQHRARGFALRDAFADLIKGLITREEASDIPVVEREVAGVVVNPVCALVDELSNLIMDKDIPYERVDSFLRRYDVQTLDQLPEEILRKLLSQLNREA